MVSMLALEMTMIIIALFLIISIISIRLKPALSKLWKKYVKAHTQLALIETRDFDRMIAMFNVERADTAKRIVSAADGYISVDRFKEVLLDEGCIVTAEHSNCDLEDRSCTYIFKVVTPKGSIGFVKLNSSLTDVVRSGKTVYTGELFAVQDYMIEDKLYICGTTQYIIGRDDDDLDTLLKIAINHSLLTWVRDEAEEARWVSYYNMVPNMFGEIELEPNMTKVEKSNMKMLNSNYSDFTFELDGKKVEVSPAKALKAIGTILKHGKNVGLTGSYGTGKSHFKAQIAAHLADTYKNEIVVISAPADVLTQFQGAKGKSQFINLMKGVNSKGKHVVLLIDEAESTMTRTITATGVDTGVHSSENTLMLAILDGELKSSLNLSSVVIFNAATPNLNSAFFRSGRLGDYMFELKQLTEERALRLVELLRPKMEGKVFDNGRFREILANDNVLDGYMYSSAGNVTTADVLSCFIPRDLTEILRAELISIVGEPKKELSELPFSISTKTAPKAPTTVADVEVKQEEAPVVTLSRNQKRKLNQQKRKGKK